MRRHHILSALLVTTLALAIWSWNRPSPHAATLPTPQIAAGKSVTYNGQTFAPMLLRLLDGTTGRPIAGADIHVVCLGGTPFGNQTNRTSARGYVEVITYQHAAWVPLQINAPGFRPIQRAVQTSDPAVKLSLTPL